MKKLKSNLQNMVLVLVSVALICGGTLAYFNQLTKPAIDEQAEKALADGIKNVLDADDITVNNKSEKKRVVNGKEQTFVVYNTDKGVAIQSTDPNAFLSVKEALEEKGYTNFIVSEVTYIPDNYIALDEETTEKALVLIENLEDIDDVQAVYHNLDV